MLSVLTFVMLLGCDQQNDKQPINNTPQDLQQHSSTFDKGVIKVTDNIHVAIGYGLANSIMIEGETGLIIIDTMETQQEAKLVLAEFRKISNKPVKAIIYTHNHTDHVFGAATFAKAGDNVEIYAHESTQYYINRVVNTLRPTLVTRSMRMFGSHLAQDELVNAGIGPFLGVKQHSNLHSMTPTKTFKEQLSVTIDGIEIQLVHAPGETEDQLFVWLPQQKVLMPGDNIYKTFPNLYTIRGTYYRDVTKWISSLDKMRRLQPDYIIPSHTRPIIGKDNISAILTVYRDAIQFVHDQTIRYMNQGLTIENVVKSVQLPQHLASHPYLQEFYGTVEWSVKSIFTGYMGWFDGNATSLQPLPELLRNKKMVQLAGGADNLYQALMGTLAEKDYQWGLMLADMLIGTEFEAKAKSVKSQLLYNMAQLESNPNARHYYFTQAKELENSNFDPAIFPKPQAEFMKQLPVASIFAAMPTSLIAEDTLDVVLTVEFWMSDIEQTFAIQIRNGIAEVQNYPLGTPDVKIETSSQVWKEIASKIRSPISAIMSGELSISTGKLQLVEFLSYFDLPDVD